MSNQQKRDKNGRFIKASKTVKIYGNLKGEPWDDSDLSPLERGPKKYFLVDFGGNDFYFYDPILDIKTKWSNTRKDIDFKTKEGWWTEIPYSTLRREFPNNIDKIDKILGIAKHSAKDQEVDKLTLSDIKIGSLYYNFGDCTVCRIIEVVGRLIYASWHKGPATPYGINSFRKATQQEVDKYLQESEDLKE